MLILVSILEETLTQCKTMKDDIIQMIKQISEKSLHGDDKAYNDLLCICDQTMKEIEKSIFQPKDNERYNSLYD
jgi:hypothetical protein